MKKYVLVGASDRAHEMYARPMVKSYKDIARVLGVFDINKVRAEYIAKSTDPPIPVYSDFDEMMRQTRPDAAIITTMDRYHHVYIIKALEYGCDAISEKPLTIDEQKCNAILEAEKRSGKKVIVTFNLRFAPYVIKIKELIKEKVIGEVLNVNFEYLLDRSHGADYFRRWHRLKENSGGLLVTKSTHHFDLVNWWLEEEPLEVYANGGRRFYGPVREERGRRCLTCAYKDSCEFAVNYQEDPYYREMYFKAEKEDGYFRDQCVFADDIDIEDYMSVIVKYSKGTILSYSLNAYSLYEGWKLAVTGTTGRLEAVSYLSGELVDQAYEQIKVYKAGEEIITYNMKKEEAIHGGSDEKLLQRLLSGDTADPLDQFADSYDGVKSVMIGVCANKSMAEKKPFYLSDFVQRAP